MASKNTRTPALTTRTGGAWGVATPIISGRSVSMLPSPSVGTVAPLPYQQGIPKQWGVPPVRTGFFSASFGPTALPVTNNQTGNFIRPKE